MSVEERDVERRIANSLAEARQADEERSRQRQLVEYWRREAHRRMTNAERLESDEWINAWMAANGVYR